jgi:ribonuclease HI
MFTDGASRGNPGPGGYGTILIYNQHRKELSQGFRKTTNNRMELMAVIAGLEALKGEGHDVLVYSDSKYVVDAVEKGWIWGWEKKNYKDRKNEDLWKRFILIYKKHNVKFKWVKGHAGNIENEKCDVLAVTSAEGPNLLIDHGYENSMG